MVILAICPMNISISKFFIIFISILFIFCVFLSQKTVAVKYQNKISSYITYERTVNDLLKSQSYFINHSEKNLLKPLGEGMVIEILSDQSIKILE
jgi:hypothetical protein